MEEKNEEEWRRDGRRIEGRVEIEGFGGQEKPQGSSFETKKWQPSASAASRPVQGKQKESETNWE